jgi:predicted CoA-binding protein
VDSALREQVLQIYKTTRTIAVVGASADETKAAHVIPRYLQSQGYRILPVNPHGGVIFGEPVATSLLDLAPNSRPRESERSGESEPVDVVDVFRPAAEAPEIARQAVAIGAKVLWLQLGIESEEARQIAEEGGLIVVMNRCLGATHRQLGLGPGPGPHR